MFTKKFGVRLMHSSALCLALVAGYASAQEADESVVVVPADEEPAADEARQDKVVVTGSRIARDEFSSAAPIDVLTADEAKIEGIADVAQLLQSSTAASGSAQINGAVSSAFVSNGGTGAETLSLRGLGANRTLFLLDGRRAGPSGTRGSVSAFDLNSIPLAAVERVEILKDGASAVYGSDAIAGVVNIITRKDDGGVIDGYISAPEKGGGEEFRLSGSYGKSFERGSVRATVDYYERRELSRGDRDYLDCGEAYAFNETGGGRADVIDPRTGEFQCRDLLWGQVWIYDYAGDTNVPTTFPFLAQYDYDGFLAANGLPGYPNTGDPEQLSVPQGFFPIYYDQNDIDGLPAWNGITVGDEARGLVDYDHPFQNAETLQPKVERFTFLLSGDFELTPNITAYGEALYNRRETFNDSYSQFWSYHYGEDSLGLFGGTGMNPEPSAQGWTGLQWFSPTAISDRNDEEVVVEYQRYVAGLRGDFTGFLDGFSWDLAYQYSDSQGDYTEDFIYGDSIYDYNFQTSLCSDYNGGVTSITNRPCVDVPWFDPELLRGNYSQEVEDFLFTKETGNTEYIQSSIEGYITGPIFELPAGTVNAAIGFLYQEDEITDTPSDIVLAGNAWGSSSAGITTGSQEQTAYYGEIEVPLLADLPFVESLLFTASGRITDISTVDETGDNYRLALNWTVTPEIRLRATQGTSFRAPGLFELYLADETSFVRQGVIDPCINWGDPDTAAIIQTNCAAAGIPDDYVGGAITADLFRGGGLGLLEPETSDNFSAGFVYTPQWADLSLAVDYFDIEINDEITTLTAQAIVFGCYESQSFPNDPLCSRFDRNAPDATDANRITDVRAQFINVNSQKNEGIDFTARYGHDTRWGRLTVEGQVTHQLESFTKLLAEDDIEDLNGEYGEPQTTGYLNFNLDTETPWSFFWGVDYIGETDQTERSQREVGTTLYGTPVRYKYYTEETIYHTFSTQYEADTWTFRVGVANVFDEHPPAVSDADAGNSLIVSQYDYLGRRAFVNITKRF
ncbi:TonB-dependent receptor [Henriciella mobilis]|uniref:TonB-dependent receptor plug domain-containing protein n=1 Tax=Henriciella mobilis TaxID=2305467 RepID=UPI000E66205B|nr:TonB-dependent receptor [Henriciella mobilis]RIJ16834.1 TonB-dependent receptor [Henriciella mobilis]RIJ19385.1 TonB-dependent receptor [Henriciella mobilis]